MPWYSCRRCGEVEWFSDDEAAGANPCDCIDLAEGDWEVLHQLRIQTADGAEFLMAVTSDEHVQSARRLTREEIERLRSLLGFGRPAGSTE